MATQDQIEQQRRVIIATQQDCASMLDLAARIETRLHTFQRLGLGADGALDAASFDGTGTTAAAYAAAIAALGQLAALDDAIWTALEAFAR